MREAHIHQDIVEIFTHATLHKWEDISQSFCLLKYAALYGKKVILLFDAAASEAELSYAKRYLAELGTINYSIIKIYFNPSGYIVPASDPREILQEVERGDRLFLTYRSSSNKVIYSNHLSSFQFLNQISTPLYLPNFRERCEEMYLYYTNNTDKLREVSEFLDDDISRSTLKELVRVFATNGIYRLPEYTGRTKYFDCYEHKEDEIWVNCGSCEGDTIFNYLSADYSFSKILAIEGDKDLFSRLEKNISFLPEETKKKIRPLNYFIGGDNDKNNFDQFFAHIPVSMINMDIEGFEMPVLRGAKNVIAKYRPVLAVSAYHLKSDLYDIPSFIRSIVKDYTFYLRKYCGYNGNSFNEFVYYCVPNERRIENLE